MAAISPVITRRCQGCSRKYVRKAFIARPIYAAAAGASTERFITASTSGHLTAALL